MSESFAIRAYGTNCFRCVVCGEERARIALQVRGRPYGLCSASPCVDHPERDARLSGALPRGVSARDMEISCAWAGVVHFAWGAAREAARTSNAPMRIINAGGSPDPGNRRRFDLD